MTFEYHAVRETARKSNLNQASFLAIQFVQINQLSQSDVEV